MSNYVPQPAAFKKSRIRDKQSRIRDKRVDELIGTIKRQESPERFDRAAERVREAQLSVLYCLEEKGYGQGNPRPDQREAQKAKIAERIDGWAEASVEEIVLHYSSAKANHENHVSHPPPGS